MKYKDLHCKYCQSKNFISLNTYKHFAVVCSDCGNVSHFKKEKYLLEYLFPRFLAKKMLPQKNVGQKFVLARIFVCGQNICLTERFVWPNIFFVRKEFWPQHFFGQKISFLV